MDDFLHSRSQTVFLDGTRSYSTEVPSGDPRVPILAPTCYCSLSVVCHNVSPLCWRYSSLPSCKNAEDQAQFQVDPWMLEQWKMEFNPDKCEVLQITWSKNPLKFNYQLHGTILRVVSETKYLGVTITSDLSWNLHVHNIVDKATNTLNFLRRNLQISSPRLKSTAYKSRLAYVPS